MIKSSGLLKLPVLIVFCHFLISCTLSLNISKKTNNSSSVGVSVQATLINKPALVSRDINLAIGVVGDNLKKYKYKIGNQGRIDCQSEEGYSADVLLSQYITDNISGFSDGPMKICVLVSDSKANWQALADSIHYEWIKDTVAPVLPNNITLIDPLSSPGSQSRPTFRISTVEVGATVYLYSNSSCKTLLASGTATTSAIDFKIPSDLADGSYSFYASQTDSAGNSSTCSTAVGNYTMDSSLTMATIANALSGTSAVVNLDLTIGGTNIISYRYKILSAPITIDCDTITGYSAEDVVSNHIIQNISGLPDGLIKVCVLGKEQNGHWQNLSGATTASWTKSVAVKNIYRSVEPGRTLALASGSSNAMSIAGTTATFSSSLAATIGVGDVIQYDSDNNGTIDSIAFIHGRSSATVFTVASASGGTPTATTSPDQDWQIFRAYTSLANAVTGVENSGITASLKDFDTWSGGHDLVTGNEQWNIALYAGASDTGNISIIGWTTDDNNILKIYTPVSAAEVGIPQRHIGLSRTGYHLDGSIYSEVQNVIIDGISVDNNSGATIFALEMAPLESIDSTVVVTHSMIKQSYSPSSGYTYAVYLGSVGAFPIHTNNFIFYDNIIIDTVGLGATTIGAFGNFTRSAPVGEDKTYAFNNTIYSLNGISILRNSGDLDIRNNIFNSKNGAYAAIDWGGNGTITSNLNNASNKDIFSGGSNNKSNQNFSFFDESAGDYRLDTQDTAAKNYGADLSNNGIYNFTDDILGRTRSGSWDIGAVESAIGIFRSIGSSNYSALASGGSNALTVSSNQASFGSDLTNADIGVGDVIQYSDGSQLRLAFITGRTSSSLFRISDANGNLPTATSGATQAWSVFRAYTSLEDALNGTENSSIDVTLRNFDNYPSKRDLKTNNYQLNLAIYADGINNIGSTGGRLQDYNTSPTNYLKLYAPYLPTEVGQSQRHRGVWNTNYAMVNFADGYGFSNFEDANHFRIEGLQISNSDAEAIRVEVGAATYSEVYVIGNLIKRTSADNSTGIDLSTSGLTRVINNIVTGWNTGIMLYSANGQQITNVYHNTVANNSIYGIRRGYWSQNTQGYLYNNISVNNGGDYYFGGANYQETAYNNISSDLTSPNASYRSASPNFFKQSDHDYRLTPQDTVAKTKAISLSNAIWPYTENDVSNHANNTSIGAYKAADEIFRSIGFNSTSALATGSGNNMTINSSCLVTFASGLPNNIGVGDAIQYDSNANTSIDSILFISYRNAANSFVAKKADGTCSGVNTVTNIQAWSIYRAYKSFDDLVYLIENSGIDGNVRNFDTNADLFATNKILNLSLYADATFTETINSEFITDDGNYVNMFVPSLSTQVGVSQRHRGTWCSSGCVTFVRTYQYDGINGGFLSWLYSDHVFVSGIQAQLNANGHVWNTGLKTTDMPRGGYFVVDSNIFDSSIDGTISVGYDDNYNSKGSTVVITNNIIKGTGTEFTGTAISVKTNSIILNNTIYGSSTGGACFAVGNDTSTSQVLINNLAQNCTTAYAGFFSSGSGYNLSNTATATGKASDLINQTISFVDVANMDFRLASSENDGVDAGDDVRNYTSLSPVLTDASGASWGTPFDIGALQKINFTSLTSFNAVGSGTSGGPYEIFSKSQLKDIGTNACGASINTGCSAYFKIMQDIDLNNEAFSPIGTNANPYTGSINGNSKTISNLNINLPTTNCVGLVGDSTGSSGSISNLTLSNVSVIGQNYVGAILGCGGADVVSSNATQGTVSGVSYVGGAIGNSASGTHTIVTTSVTITASSGIGGGVLGSCTSCSLTGGIGQSNVTGTAKLGGIIGQNVTSLTLNNCISTGNISGTNELGGVIGVANSATIDWSSAHGRVYSSTASATKIGGFIGDAAGSTVITKSISLGDVTATNNSSNVGGFAGMVQSAASLINIFSTSFVRGAANVGGIVGYSTGMISHAVFSGRVEGNGYQVGGICGDLYSGGIVRYSSAKGTVYGGSGNSVGGISGRAYGSTVHHTIFEGDVYNSGDATGGIVGFNAGSSIYSNSSKTNVVGNTATGGILGINNSASSDVHDNQAEGFVQSMVEEAGGVIGWDDGTGSFRNRFDGAVVAVQDAGGYAGESSAGSSGISEAIVNASVYANTNMYAFIGNKLGADPTKSFWDTNLTSLGGISGTASSANKFEGKTSDQLKTASTFSGTSAWNFSSNWSIDDGVDYPVSKTMIKGECSNYRTATSYTAAGSGSEVSPYLICTLAQFNDIGISGCGSGTSAGCTKYFRIGSDIDFKGTWPTKIGDYGNVFTGVLDGQGFTLKNLTHSSFIYDMGIFQTLSGVVKNLKIDRVRLSSSSNQDRVGVLAGRLSSGIVINVTVNDFSISNVGYEAGGLIGLANGGYILGSETQGTISSGTSIGGLVGKHTSSIDPLVVSFSKASVDLSGVGGGLIGAGQYVSLSHIRKSFATGVLSGTNGGGISGGSTAIFESLASVIVASSGSDSGGLAMNSDVYDSYTYGSNISASSNFGGAIGVLSSLWGLKSFRSYSTNTVSAGGNGYGSTVACTQVTGSDNFWDSDVAGSTGCSNAVQSPKTTSQLKTASTFTNWDFTSIWAIGETVRRPRLQWELHPLCRANMTATTYNAIGAGTFANPYKICFKEQLQHLSSNGCGSTTNTACSSSFLLLNDIDFESQTFNMIGDTTNQFVGTFNGGGHRILRARIYAPASDNIGFFSALQTAFITNIIFDRASVTGRDNTGVVAGRFWGPATSSHFSGVSVVNSTVTGRNYVGGAIGLLNGVAMDRINIKATISGNTYVGGVIGSSNGAASTLLENVSFNGSINSTSNYVGGILGDCSGTITRVKSIGTISSTGTSVGGICGNVTVSTVIRNTISMADVSGAGNTGGLLGTTSSITLENNFYKGTVTATGSNNGGFIGSVGGGFISYNFSIPTLSGPTSAFAGSYGSGVYTNNYWDSTVSGVTTGNAAGNYDPLTTAQAKIQGNFSGWDFSEKWVILTNQYPEPR